MGCCQSRMELEETLSRCKARRRYMKQLVKGRQAFAIAHFLYLRSLRSTGAALLQFANAETPVRHHLPPMAPSPPPTPPRPQRSKAPPSPPPPPPPPPQMSPCSDNWTSATASPLLHPLPPPPPPPPPSSSWDFWDPFLPSSRSVAEEWEDATTTTITTTATATTTMASEAVAASAAPPPSSVVGGFSISEDSASELAMVVSRNKKSLSEIVKELDDYFLKAADAGNRVSAFLEAPNCGFSSDQGLTGRICSYGRSLSPLRWPWGWSSKANQYGGFERLGEASMAKRDAAALFGGDFMSHRSTVEKLYAWEKKLYLEVKNAERLKEEHEKKVGLLRRQEARGADYLKVEKTRKEIERLESRLTVASQAMETTSLEIVRVREVELFPQLVELLNRLRAMWRSMYECHQVQTHIVQQLEYLNDGGGGGGADPTSELHRQSTLQLELEVQRWHSSFCELIESQRDYIHSLAGWLRLSLFGGAAGKPRHHHHHITAEIYSLLEEWQLALDRVPDKVASEGIKSFLTVVHAVVLQQDEEHRQRRRSEAAGRALEKAAAELMRSSPAPAREGKVAAARARAEEEKSKWEKSAGITRAMTLNSLQTGFPNVFQAMTGFSGVCTQAFESVYGHRRSPRELKMLLP